MKAKGLVFDQERTFVSPDKLYDKSRYGHTVTDTDIAYIKLKSGLYVPVFNATSSRIIITTHKALDDLMDRGGTIAAWFNAASDGEADSGTMMQSGFTPEVVGFQLYVAQQSDGFVKLIFAFRHTVGSGSWTTSTAIIPIDTWTFVVITYNCNNIANNPIIYLNGAPTAIDIHAPAGARKSDAGTDWVIGGASDGTFTFDGQISLARAWPRVHNPEQIAAHYQAERHFFGV